MAAVITELPCNESCYSPALLHSTETVIAFLYSQTWMLGKRNGLAASSVAEAPFSVAPTGQKFEINFPKFQKFIKNVSEDNGSGGCIPSLLYLSVASLSLTLFVFLLSSSSLYSVWLRPSLSFPLFSHNSLLSRPLNLYPRAFSESSFSFTAMEEPPGFICLPLYRHEKKKIVRGKEKALLRTFNMPPTCLKGLNTRVRLESLCSLM